LLDEPLSSLDHETRLRLQDEIMGMHKHFNLTTILISHDKDEILKLSDHVVKLDQGKIVKQGTGDEVFPTEINNANILVQGIVGNISHEELHSIVEIISGDQNNRIQVLRAQTADLKAGDQIMVKADLAHVTILKL
jgi:molybdate transport system ATP-binding protein